MKKILLIDDKKDNLVSLSALLRNLLPDITVITAQSGLEGIETARTGQPDVILLDVMMPDMDGFETCRRLTIDENTRHIPVIMITAIKADAASRIKGLEIGANSFLAKPIDEAELVSQVKVALRIKMAEDALRQERSTLEHLVAARTAALRESKALLETAGRVARFGGWAINLAVDKVIWSDEVAAIHEMPAGYSPDLETGISFYAPEWQEKIRQFFSECANKGIAYDEEMEIITARGNRVWVRTTGQAVYDENHRIIKVEGAFQDISEYKRAEEALRTSEEQIRFQAELLRNAPMIAAFYDTDYNIVWVNKACEDSAGLSAQNLVGKKCYAIWGLSKPCENCPVIMAIEKGEPCHAELTPQNQNDWAENRGHWDVRAAPVRDKAGKIIGAIEMAVDISERAKLNNQLLQSQKMESVGRLAGGVAHDFNNMLGVILGYAELAIEKLAPSEPLHENLNEIIKAANRSKEITRQLLAFARKQTISPQILDLNETVEGMFRMLRRLIGEDIELTWKPENNLWAVKMDPSQIDQILANLCVNARDAIATGGEITIGTGMVTITQADCANNPSFLPGKFVRLSVKDTGCGMSQQTMSQLFEPFFTTKDPGKGTGLGLATVYGIVKQNNGFIEVCSETDHGSTFNVYLPCQPDTSPQLPADSAPAIPSGHGETILIVEDELSMLKISKIMLEKLNYKILAAATPNEGLRLAREYGGQINLLLTDVIMPEMSGHDLANLLTELNPDLKTLFMSGYTANAIAHHGVLDKGIQFIQKPFLMKDLSTKVYQALYKS